MAKGVSASHIPVLVYLAGRYNFKNVLEIGSGELSTPLFLNQKVFSRLERLVSIEEDPEWFDKMKALCGEDKRWTLKDKMPASFLGHDLIFIDGPQDRHRRGRVIAFIMRDIISPFILIHDIEYKPYRRFLNTKYYEYIFEPVPAPATGLYSRHPLPEIAFKKINRVMKKKFSQFEEDWAGWQKVLV